MKTKLSRISKRSMAVILSILMLLSCMLVGTISADAGSWIAFKRLYFGVPKSWTNSFTNVYAAARQTNGYAVIIGKLTSQVANSNIYGTTTGQNIDHSTWGNEYLYIFATNSSYTVGTGYGSSSLSTVYATSTTTSSMVNITNLNSTSNNYFIYPQSDANGCAISYSWNNYGDMGYLGTDGTIADGQGHTPYAQQKASCNTGGKVAISGFRIKANSAATFSAHSASAATNPQLGCILGSKVTLTATANSSSYVFDGFYSDSSYSTKLSSSSTYTYTVTSTDEKTIYAKFNPNETTYTVTKKYQINGGTVTNDGTQSGVGSSTATTISFDLFKTSGTVRYKLTGFNSSGVTISSSSTTTGEVVCTASSNSAYITALYATEADYQQVYFKIPSGWSNAYVYLWNGDGSEKNAEWPGIKMVTGSTQAASGANTDSYGTCDYYGSTSIQNGDSTDTYYYYKTYNTLYTKVIFNNGNGSYQTRDLTLANIQSETASGQTYTKNNMYYVPSANVTTGSQESGKWYALPAALYSVTVSATDSSVSRVNTTGASSATGTKSGDTSGKVKVNGTTGVNVTITPPSGYTIDQTTPWNTSGSVTLTKVSLSTTSMTYTVKATANGGSISPNFVETPRTVTVYRRLYNTAGTQQGSNTQVTTYTAGISSYATVAQPDETSGDYTWQTYTLGSGITNTQNSTLTTRAALRIQAKASGTYAVYEDYKETLYTMTIQRNNTNYGVVKRDNTGSGLTSTQVGNVTYVSLTAVNNDGYEFSYWEITPASGKTVTIQKSDGTGTTEISSATGSSAPAAGNIRRNATLKFKMNGTATVKAYFTPVAYSVTGVFANTYASGNSITFSNITDSTKTGSGNVGDTIQFVVTVADGYEISGSPSFSTATGYAAPTLVSGYPQTSANGSTTTYRYTMPAAKVAATITLKAKTPSLTGYVKNNTAGFASYSTISATGATVNNYYLQPADMKATTDPFATIGYTVNGTAKDSGLSNSSSSNNRSYASPTGSNYIATTEEGYRSYKVKITATNEKTGVDTVTTEYEVTIRLYFNAEQKAYFKMKRLYQNSVDEDASTAATYYETGAPWSAYHTQRESVYNNYADGNSWGLWPAYNTTATTVQNVYTNYFTAFKNLQAKAETTTVYVLSKYANTSTQYMSILGSSNGTAADYNRYKQYHFYLADVKSACVKTETNYVNHLMTYEGKAGSTYYLYSFTYAGKANAQIYTSTTKAGLSTATANTSRLLTGTVTGLSTIGNDYYINVYNTTYSNSPTTPTATNFVDLHSERNNTGKAICEVGITYTGTQIKTLLGLNTTASKKGSLYSESPNIAINDSEFKIQSAPNSDLSTINLSTTSWKPTKQGRYKVTYKIKYNNAVDNDESGGATFEHTGTYYVYVAYEEIKVYVDMNDNVGTPTLNFTYYKNSSGTPVASGTSGATTATLPFNMSLVNGSESIYEYTLNLKNLSTYYIKYKNDSTNALQAITINSISVDGTKYYSNPPTNSAGFTIKTDAYVNGAVWFKANSTSMNTFLPIACQSVTNSFRAIVDSSGTHIGDAIEHVTGTGVITDDTEGIYEVLYAGYDKNADSNGVAYNFSYNVTATAKAEVVVGSATYYFDRWMKVAAPEDGAGETYFTTAANFNALTATGSEKRDYHINSAPLTTDGDYIYVAVYKPAATSGVARVEVTYNFKDYNTDDGNYIYDSTKDLKDASYTKTVKVPFGSGKTYTTFAAVKNAYKTIAKNNTPQVVSNYFDYSYPTTDSSTRSGEDDTNFKFKVTSELTHTVHTYRIIVVNGTTYYRQAAKVKTGNYQQTVTLNASDYGVSGTATWYVKNGSTEVPLHSGTSYEARFIQSGFTTDGTLGDTIYLYIKSGSTTVDKTSAIVNSYNEVYKETGSDTEKVRHNFYIVDYLDSSGTSTLVGAGAIVATTTNGTTYSQSNAATVFSSPANIKSYIERALKSGSSAAIDYTTERPQQTIENISFRYLPYDSTNGKNTLRYSDQLKGYHYIYGLQNAIDDKYNGQTLRVYSFFIYDTNGTKTIAVSPTYAELSRNP